MDLYAENILDHFRHPRGKVALKQPSVRHQEMNLSCGDELTIDLVIENGKVTSAGWQGTGCAISQAAMSMLSEELAGKSVEEVTAMQPATIYGLLGVPVGPRRFKCALLGLHTLKNALRVYRKEKPQGWVETVAIDE